MTDLTAHKMLSTMSRLETAKHAEDLGVHVELIHAHITAQAAQDAGYSVFHAVALETAAKAEAFLLQNPERASEMLCSAAAFERNIAARATGLPRALLLLNVADWLLAASAMDQARAIAVEMLAEPQMPYIKARFESIKDVCETALRHVREPQNA